MRPQRQMVETGWMHGYMRMYWAKKILEWAPDPARAFEWAVMLNDNMSSTGATPTATRALRGRSWVAMTVPGLISRSLDWCGPCRGSRRRRSLTHNPISASTQRPQDRRYRISRMRAPAVPAVTV